MILLAVSGLLAGFTAAYNLGYGSPGHKASTLRKGIVL